MPALQKLLGRRFAAYSLGVLATGLMLLLRWAMDPLLGDTAQFLVFYFSVVLAAFIGGVGPALVAVALGTVSGTWLFEYLGHTGAGWADDATRLVSFLLFGGVAAVMADRVEKARRLATVRGKEEQFRAFFERAAVGAAQVDGEGRLIQVNDRYCQITGYARQELLGMDPGLLVHSDNRQHEQVCFKQFLAGRTPTYEAEIRYVRKDGRVIWVRSTAGRIYGARNELTGSAVIIEDITARKEAEAALRESETKYRIVADNTYDWEFWISPQGEFLYNSPSCRNVTGYEAQDFKTDPDLLYKIIHPADQQLYDHHRGFGGRACATEDVEFRIVRRDGAHRWIRHTCMSVYGEDGQFLGTRGTNRDITEQRESLEALRESEEKFRALAENAPAAIGIIQDTRFVYANRHFLQLTGSTREELASTHFAQIVHPDYRDMVIDRAQRRLRGEPVPNQYEVVLLTKSGQSRWIDFSPALIEYQGKPAIIGAGLDVTERKNSEQALAAAKASAEEARLAAEEAGRVKDQFLAVLSHELRTPLTPVLAAVSMLQKKKALDGGVGLHLDMIRRNVELEARLIDDLLDVTRITRGRIELNKQPVELQTVIARAAEVCGPDISARRLHFGVDWDTERPYVVEADVARLQQVFWNLLKNAIKFTPPGGCVGVRCRAEGDQVIAEVNDSGMGIEPEIQRHIFDAFTQSAAARQFGGLGLGLAIAKSLVELHGGTIAAHSEGKGKGATFIVRLPRILASLTAPVQPGGLASSRERPLRILVVEDHGDTADMMRVMLASEGHQISMAGDVETALEEAGQSDFDLLISDLGLPDGSGLDLIRQLRARGQNLPGIALSGYGQENDLRSSREAGFAAHIVKPVDLDGLLSVLAEVAGATKV